MASVDLEEKANFTRLSRLLVDKGTDALRTTFDTIHPPANLPAVLNANRKSLLRLKFRVINNCQWDLLFPPSGSPPDSKNFDVTLLTVLFRNICGLPSTGWDTMPPDTDRTMQANIVRLKAFRNKIYAHVPSTEVDSATFELLWKKISQALVELNISQKDVDCLKTCPLGPEEEIYVKTLKEWKSQEEESTKVLRAIAEENRDAIKQLHHSILEQRKEVQALQSSGKTYSKESDEDLLQKLSKHNFKSKICSKGKFFHPGSRNWLLQKVDELVRKEHESRILLLTAGPGFGKSVFAAKICEDFERKGKLAASHFCDFSNSNLRDPMMMLQSLASQMCENIAGFREKLLDQLRRPHQIQSLKDAFKIYLQNPLDELDLEDPRLVVIDGLDESAADDKNEILNLIDDYFQCLPECLRFLVTSRPWVSLKNLKSPYHFNIRCSDVNNTSDIKLYLKANLPSLVTEDSEKDLETDLREDPEENSENDSEDDYDSEDECALEVDVFDDLAEKCEGSFLYAFYLQSELRKRDDFDAITLDEIMEFVPKGLDAIYLTYFRRFQDEVRAVTGRNLNVLRILEMLAVSKSSLPLSFISRVLGLARDSHETIRAINQVNEIVSCLLYVSDDLVTIFHKSVIDWLVHGDHEYAVQVDEGHKSLWLICEKVFDVVKKTVCSGEDLKLTTDVEYALRHGFEHLGACILEESLFWLTDIVIIHVWLTIYPKSSSSYLLDIWVKIFQNPVVFISDKLRERLSWHVLEVGFLKRRNYLQNVLRHFPENCFNDNEKKIIESLLPKVPQFVEYNLNEVEFSPVAACRLPPERRFVGKGGYSFSVPSITAADLSHDKAMAAVADEDGNIHLMSVPKLVKLWKYSPRFEDVSCCSFAPDDSIVLFGKLATALNVAERTEVPFFHGNKETFYSCGFSPNGKRLVTSNGSKTIKLWDVSGQSLLALLSADEYVYLCSFSNTGLFIIADKNYDKLHSKDSFCVWNAVTWQRSDERSLRHEVLKEPRMFRNKKCKRCFQPGFKELNSSKRLEIQACMPLARSYYGEHWEAWSTGIYNGEECSFCLKPRSLSVTENTHFTTLAVWNTFVSVSFGCFFKITAIEDNLWFYSDKEKLIVFKTFASTHQKPSPLPHPTRVLWSSFSPDGSRLATCTSNGYINIWNANTNQIEQRYKGNQDESSFACWWSNKCLFVFDFFYKIPNLVKYPVDGNLKILFSQSQQVSLLHLLAEFVSFSAVVDFSEGLLIFECGNTTPVKVLDVSGVGGPRMVTLPEIKTEMNITVSPDASLIFGSKNIWYIWKRSDKKPAMYDVLFTNVVDFKKFDQRNFGCCFTNDSKIAVVVDKQHWGFSNTLIIDLDRNEYKNISLPSLTESKHFCLEKDRLIICAYHDVITFVDMDSGARLESFLQRYLTEDLIKQVKFSSKETMIAFPNVNGNIHFIRLRIPQDSLLSTMKHEAKQYRAPAKQIPCLSMSLSNFGEIVLAKE